jgi:hypothetical protein
MHERHHSVLSSDRPGPPVVREGVSKISSCAATAAGMFRCSARALATQLHNVKATTGIVGLAVEPNAQAVLIQLYETTLREIQVRGPSGLGLQGRRAPSLLCGGVGDELLTRGDGIKVRLPPASAHFPYSPVGACPMGVCMHRLAHFCVRIPGSCVWQARVHVASACRRFPSTRTTGR